MVFYKQVPGDFHFFKRTRFRGLLCLSYLDMERVKNFIFKE